MKQLRTLGRSPKRASLPLNDRASIREARIAASSLAKANPGAALAVIKAGMTLGEFKASVRPAIDRVAIYDRRAETAAGADPTKAKASPSQPTLDADAIYASRAQAICDL